MRSPIRAVLFVLGFLALSTTAGQSQGPLRITSPQQQFGHEIGADYRLPNYTQLTEYWQKLDRESDRMQVVEIGKTAEGRPHLMAILTAPENFKKLDRYRDIARRLALAEDLTDDQARQLSQEGKAVVWIDGGLHATEVLGAQQLMELVYQMVSRNDAETTRILRDVIILAVHANPDGMELVSNWYMREPEPTRRSTSAVPRLYQKYIGHDNNRDFYMATQAETINITRVQYREWFPQIVYNHHQTGPTGTVLFAPPFRDPFNYNFDPLIPLGIDMVGAAMHGRFAAEGKPGATMRRGANYSTWWNGGLRTAVYFHNMIGLLTESIGNPTPIEIPFVPQRQLPSGDLPFPIAPQKWHFRQSIDYSMTANRAVLDLASRYKDTFLFNIYRMGRNSIERGSRDSWTPSPKDIDAVRDAIAKGQSREDGPGFSPAATIGGFSSTADARYFDTLRNPDHRDARGYILPSNQPDFLTATKFINALIKNGIAVHRATRAFDVAGRSYPAGSYVVKTAQAFRPHVLDMFEPQDHPNDFQYPGGPPIPPYDNAGYTLAYQMGVSFDRVLEGFDGPFERIPDLLTPPPGRVQDAPGAEGFYLSPRVNDAFLAVNRLLKSGEDVSRVPSDSTVNGVALGRGAFFVRARPSTRPLLETLAGAVGLTFHAAASVPGGDLVKLRPMRVGLWDRYGGSMPSGWIRWILEQYEFPFEVVYPQTLDAGNLNNRFDVLIFPDEAIPETDAVRRGPFSESQPSAASVPEEYRERLGTTTVARTVPQIKAFVEAGGVVIAIGSSSASLAAQLHLPLGNALVEQTAAGDTPLPREKFYLPGSILRTAVQNAHPLAWGLDSDVDVFFDNSPAFRLKPQAPQAGTTAVAWYATATPLRSGWAWGQHYLEGAVAAAESRVGRGRVLLFGPEITFRAQPHGTFKFLFNGIANGGSKEGS